MRCGLLLAVVCALPLAAAGSLVTSFPTTEGPPLGPETAMRIGLPPGAALVGPAAAAVADLPNGSVQVRVTDHLGSIVDLVLPVEQRAGRFRDVPLSALPAGVEVGTGNDLLRVRAPAGWWPGNASWAARAEAFAERVGLPAAPERAWTHASVAPTELPVLGILGPQGPGDAPILRAQCACILVERRGDGEPEVGYAHARFTAQGDLVEFGTTAWVDATRSGLLARHAAGDLVRQHLEAHGKDVLDLRFHIASVVPGSAQVVYAWEADVRFEGRPQDAPSEPGEPPRPEAEREADGEAEADRELGVDPDAPRTFLVDQDAQTGHILAVTGTERVVTLEEHDGMRGNETREERAATGGTSATGEPGPAPHAVPGPGLAIVLAVLAWAALRRRG